MKLTFNNQAVVVHRRENSSIFVAAAMIFNSWRTPPHRWGKDEDTHIEPRPRADGCFSFALLMVVITFAQAAYIVGRE
jgi:hypothetical protein